MKNIGFVFAGQGSQTTGMGSDLYNNFQEAREVYDFLEEDLKKISFEGSIEEISDTRNLQPLMVALELSILKILVSKGVKPVAACGLSLGEYAALRAAEIVNEKEILEAITVRGQAMAEAAKTVESGMAAVMNLSYDEIQSIVKEVSQNDSNVYISNLNSSRQIVNSQHRAVEPLRSMDAQEVAVLGGNRSPHLSGPRRRRASRPSPAASGGRRRSRTTG